MGFVFFSNRRIDIILLCGLIYNVLCFLCRLLVRMFFRRCVYFCSFFWLFWWCRRFILLDWFFCVLRVIYFFVRWSYLWLFIWRKKFLFIYRLFVWCCYFLWFLFVWRFLSYFFFLVLWSWVRLLFGMFVYERNVVRNYECFFVLMIVFWESKC